MILQSQKTKEETPVILNPGKAAISKIKDVYRQMIYLKHQDGELLTDIRLRLEPVLLNILCLPVSLYSLIMTSSTYIRSSH